MKLENNRGISARLRKIFYNFDFIEGIRLTLAGTEMDVHEIILKENIGSENPVDAMINKKIREFNDEIKKIKERSAKKSDEIRKAKEEINSMHKTTLEIQEKIRTLKSSREILIEK